MRGTCELCGRTHHLTFHHLIPRTLHKNKWFKKRYTREDMISRGLDLCRDCHSAIHTLIPSEKTLGRDYNTKAALLAHEQLLRYVTWVSTQRTHRRFPVRRP